MSTKASPPKPTGKTAKKPAAKVADKVKKKAARKAPKKAAKKAPEDAAGKAARKTTKKTATKTVRNTAKKTGERSQQSREHGAAVSASSRNEMIEKAAYYRAEKRDYHDSDPVADWLDSEKEIDALLQRRRQ